VSEARRALVVPELPLAIDAEAIATIAPAEADASAAWLPALVFGAGAEPPSLRRALLLVDGRRVEVPATMQLVDAVEVLGLPELLSAAAERIGVTGLAVLDGGLALFCDPRLTREAER
jgi:hypothetical protein